MTVEKIFTKSFNSVVSNEYVTVKFINFNHDNHKYMIDEIELSELARICDSYDENEKIGFSYSLEPGFEEDRTSVRVVLSKNRIFDLTVTECYRFLEDVGKEIKYGKFKCTGTY